MSEEMASYVAGSTAPAGKPHRENGRYRGVIPMSWMNRPVRIDYTDASGGAQSVRATLLDAYPAGPILAMNGGARTLIVWERLALVELVEG